MGHALFHGTEVQAQPRPLSRAVAVTVLWGSDMAKPGVVSVWSPLGLPFLFFCHTLNPSPSAGRVRGLKGSTHLSPVHALHFVLADWVSTPAPRQLPTNTQLTTLFTHALTLSTVGIRLRRKKPTHLEQWDPYTTGTWRRCIKE